MAGVRTTDRTLIRAARTMGVDQRTIIRHVMIPSALPQILTGARIAGGAAWMSLVAAELIGAPSGLGFAIEWYRQLLMTPKVIAVIVVISLLGYLTDRALRWLQQRLTPGAPVSGGPVSTLRWPRYFILPVGLIVLWQLWGMTLPAQPRACAARCRDRRGRSRRQRPPAHGHPRASAGSASASSWPAAARPRPAHGLLPPARAQSRPDHRELPPGGPHRAAAHARHPLARHRHAGRGLHRRLCRLLPHDRQHHRRGERGRAAPRQAAQTLGVPQLTILRTVVLPAALPSIFVGVRVAMGLAWMSIIAAELAVGSKGGGGGSSRISEMMFVFYAYYIELDSIVVCMIAVGLVALAIDHGLRWLQRWLMPWAEQYR
ncbi:MAG: ABC transporter permease subunit [Geminicoccaceae bacterium]